MRSTHPTVRRIKLAMQVRGVRNYAALVAITGIGKHYLEKIMSDPKVDLPKDDRERIAEALFVEDAWLGADDDQVADKAAPAWAKGGRLPLTPSTQGRGAGMPPDLELSTSGTQLECWWKRLQQAWDDYLSKDRCPICDPKLRAVLKQPTADGDTWERVHRSCTVQPITKFSLARQFALAQVLSVPETPDFSQLSQWEKERNNWLRSYGFVGPSEPLDLEFPWHPHLHEKVGCYEYSMGRLEEKKKVLLQDNNSISRRVPYMLVAVVKAMEQVFAHRFPDDPRLSLYDAVRVYRDFRRRTYISREDQIQHKPEICFSRLAFWRRQQDGHIIGEDEVLSYYESWNLTKGDMLADFNKLESDGRIRQHRSNGKVWYLLCLQSEWSEPKPRKKTFQERWIDGEIP